MTGEQCIFAIEGNRPDQILDLVGVDLDAAVRQEGLETCRNIPLKLRLRERSAGDAWI